MDCTNASAQLWAMLDGELLPKEQEELKIHLAQCDKCRAEYERLCEMKELLSKDLVDAPQGFAERTVLAMRKEKRAKAFKVLIPRISLGVAAAFVVVVGINVLPALMRAGSMAPTNSADMAAENAPALYDSKSAYDGDEALTDDSYAASTPNSTDSNSVADEPTSPEAPTSNEADTPAVPYDPSEPTSPGSNGAVVNPYTPSGDEAELLVLVEKAKEHLKLKNVDVSSIVTTALDVSGSAENKQFVVTLTTAGGEKFTVKFNSAFEILD